MLRKLLGSRGSMAPNRLLFLLAVVLLLFAGPLPRATAAAGQLRVLFLGGSSGGHRPAEMANLLQTALASQQITVDYTERVEDLQAEKLANYDALLIFKDDGELSGEQEEALLAAVDRGLGLVAVHCASHCFRKSERYTKLIGGRFERHGTEEFRARIIDAQHPAMGEVASFTTRDETYVHNELAADNRVLMAREESGGYEPYTWVRQHGKGRVYYTALGHDGITWRQPAFHRQLEAAIRWVAQQTHSNAPPQEIVDGSPLPLAPADSMRHMHLPEGFRVELFAAEPDVVKPIAMNFDARGRAWVIESVDYPNDLRDPFQGNDRIKILEDTNGDGRADKFTIFAEGLNIPTGIQVVQGGAIVALAPHIVFFEDTDGDDRADKQTILYTGFGRADTHAVHGNFRWGPDNWIWATVGYSGGDVTVGNVRRKFGQSLFRFRPDGSELEILTATSNNTWGLAFNTAGIPFASTANNEHSIHLAIPNRYIERVHGLLAKGSGAIEDHKLFHHISDDLRQVDVHGGYTAASSYSVYSAEAFPEEYRHRAALVCEPTGHLVHIDFLVPQGASFVARDGYNLLASTDPWVAPIETHLGPDGAVWMVDWYNYIVRHNPTPPGYETGPGNAYITPQRDKTHGRIYRIVHEDAPAAEQPRLDTATNKELIATLGNTNQWWRMHAQRILVERGLRDPDVRSEVIPLLCAEILRLTSEKRDPYDNRSLFSFSRSENDPIVYEPSALAILHALWTLDGLGYFADTAIADRHEVLHHAVAYRNSAVRAAAIRLVPQTDMPVNDVVHRALRLKDADPQVHLASLLAMADYPPGSALGAFLPGKVSSSSIVSDPYLRLALTCAIAQDPWSFFDGFSGRTEQDGDQPWNGPPEGLDVIRQVAEHCARSGYADSLGSVIFRTPQMQSAVATAIFEGFAAGASRRYPPRSREVQLIGESVKTALPKLAPSAQVHAIATAQNFGAAGVLQDALVELRGELLQRVASAELDVPERLTLARQLISLSTTADETDSEVIASLLGLITPQAPPELSTGVLDALAASPNADIGEAVLNGWSGYSPTVRQQALSTLLRRPVWTGALLNALAAGELTPGDLAVDQRQQLRNHPRRELARRAEKLLSTAAGTERPLAEQLQRLLPLAEREGDPHLGQKVFEQQCAKCHRLGKNGESIGPDLTGISVRGKAAILVDVVDPNRSVEGNYRQYTVTTRAGLVLSGLLNGETATGIELLDSQAKRHPLLRTEIDEMVASELSVMPEGFGNLPEDELVALLTFLAKPGRYVPLPLTEVATIDSVRGMFYSREATSERLVLDHWGPREVYGVPFQLIDPQEGRVPNVVLLHSPNGPVTSQLPEQVSVLCQQPAKQIHLLSGVAGWAWPLGQQDSVSLIVRLHYADGQTEEHLLRNGRHMADYMGATDVPESRAALNLGAQQVRYLKLRPQREAVIEQIELVKGDDQTAPIIMAITVERDLDEH